MANKKVNQLISKPAVNLTDLFLIADPTSGQAYKTTISDLGTAIGSGVSSVNSLVGAVVLDTDDIQELVSPTNKWFTDTRARAALSAGTGISYNSGTGVISSSITQYTDALARAAISGGTGISYNSTTGVITNNITQYTDALARGAISLTVSGSSGASTYNSTTGVLNVPTYTLSGLGGVPTTRTLTINGTELDLSANRSWTIDAYTLPTATDSVLGGVKIGSGVTIDSGVISVSTNYQAPLSGTGFVKISGSTISYDNSTYLTTSSASSTYLPLAGGTLTGAVTGTRMVLVQNSSDIALSIVQTGTGGGLSVLGTSYFSADIQLGSVTADSILKTNGTGRIAKAVAGTDYVIPSALSSYLPLSGGTLTGALSGTSASFSGLTVDNNQNGSTWVIAKNQNAGSGAAAGFLMTNNTGDLGAISLLSSGNSPANGLFIRTLSTNSLILGTNSTANLTIANGGAATFSSSVATTRLLVGGATGNFPIDSYTTSRIGVRSWTDIAGTTNNFFIQNGGNYNYGVLGVVSATGTSTGDVYGLGYTASAGTAMTSVINWTSNGKVGIGTTYIPSSRLLAVSGSVQFNGAALMEGANFSIVPAANGQDGVVLNVGYDTGLDYGSLFISTGGNTSMILDKNANATFSGSVSASFLTTKSSSGAAALLMQDTSGANKWEIGHQSGALYFYNYGTNNSPVYINSSGKVGIGTTSPTATLDVNSGTVNTVAAFRSTDAGAFVGFADPSTTLDAGYPTLSIGAIANDMTFNTSNSERMRITSGGLIGIGTSAPFNFGTGSAMVDVRSQNTSAVSGVFISNSDASARLTMYINNAAAATIGTSTNHAVQFVTQDVERMRIDSSGQTFTISAGTALSAGVTASAGTSTAIYVGRYGGTAGSYNSGTVSYVVWSNGNVVNTNNSYGAYSDIKLKENITDATSKLTDLLKVKIRNYNLIGDDKKQLGVIAQELEQVFPNMVEEVKQLNSNETIKSVKYSIFVPMLIKAVQELSDKITTLQNK